MIDQAIVLASGRGVHTGPLTRDRPRAMLPALGRPMVARVMERLREAGIQRCVVIVGEDEGEVASYLHTFRHRGEEITFCLQAASLGLAHALAEALHSLTGPFVLVNSELLFPVDFLPRLLRRFESAETAAVLGVIQVRGQWQESLLPVRIEGEFVSAVLQAPQLAGEGEYGAFLAYACAPAVLPYLTGQRAILRTEHDLPEVLQRMIADGLPIGHAHAAWALRLIEYADLLAINRLLLREERDAHILSELPGSVQIVPPVRIDPHVSVGQRARIGPNVYLETDCVVGQGAVISDAVVLRGATVRAGEQVRGSVVTRRSAEL